MFFMNKEVKKILEQEIQKILPQVIHFRHLLHRIPEIAGKEFKTSAAIRENLAGLDLEILPPFLQTDVVAILNKNKSENLTLRADIDALPVEEDPERFPYASCHKGMKHACGHDGHTAVLYGAACVLSAMKEFVHCSVRFLFQPGEEIACMAKDLIGKGALLDPEPAFVTGLHSWPNEPYGKICTKEGPLMAAAGFFRIKLYGKGGHGSLPHLSRNPLDCASAIMFEAKKIVPEGNVLSFCSCNGGTNNTIIPDEAELLGTIRFLDPEKGKKMLEEFEVLVNRIAEKYHIKVDFSCPVPYPPLINRKEDFEKVRKIVENEMGENAFHTLDSHVMSSEDFSFYLQKYPGVFVHLGSGDDSAALHSAGFDFDDHLLETGIRYFCTLALELFAEK